MGLATEAFVQKGLAQGSTATTRSWSVGGPGYWEP